MDSNNDAAGAPGGHRTFHSTALAYRWLAFGVLVIAAAAGCFVLLYVAALGVASFQDLFTASAPHLTIWEPGMLEATWQEVWRNLIISTGVMAAAGFGGRSALHSAHAREKQ